MKKSIMLLVAAGLVAVMTGCGGGGGSSASSKAAANPATDTTTEQAFDVAPEQSATNVTYKTAASGSFPPAPPVSDLADAQAAANAKL